MNATKKKLMVSALMLGLSAGVYAPRRAAARVEKARVLADRPERAVTDRRR
ncbi:hypothetical protein [Candidatus Burkholderia verschuerenii]|uniref:hypothetical protein n=1 Tax=Candidatus Burkholderia verschuerenii TaxID=242163 RepID=UPI000B2D09EA|nr:hypothetical protein [Candidatus Burkholderia verschuerenii]